MTQPNERTGPDSGPVTRRKYDWADVLPSTAVVESIATATNRKPLTLPPLQKAVNADAVDSLFARDGPDRQAAAASVSFQYAGHQVTVHHSGVVEVQQVDIGPHSP